MGGQVTAMFLSNDDQRIRFGLVGVIFTALMAGFWLQRRGR